MSDYIFEIKDKTSGRDIHLSKERWRHIRKKHPEIENIDEIKSTIKYPDTVRGNLLDNSVYYFYKYFKHKVNPEKFLMVVVKYLNGDGFVITAFLRRNIK